jgi:hypothetical protein
MRRIGPTGASLVVVVSVAVLTLAFSAAISLAADYQDAQHNVCEGTFSAGSCSWGSHVAGLRNVAVGDAMMPALTKGSDNIALDFGALAATTEGSSNVAIGTEALEHNTTGSTNIALGGRTLRMNTTGSGNTATGVIALEHNTEGVDNVASGFGALASNTIGDGNVATGFLALNFDTVGSNNVASGFGALEHSTVGNANVAIGTASARNVTTGERNVAIGISAGKNLTTGSDDVDIANEGVAAESGATRIGTEGTQTKAYVAGVYRKAVGASACSVEVNSEGQLGCNSEGDSGAVATFVATKEVASGTCLDYGGMAKTGSGACAAKTEGFSTSLRLAPMPANGGNIADLNADSNANVSGTDTVLVAVIDNTTGATLLSCTVSSGSPHSCSNSSEAASAGPGDNVEVKITASGESGNKKAWRVTFRF